ncbi:MAG: hypothetical protein KDD69_12270 [Bdellovibrionales bacterium]|nr:hypothetical protein [Bdellovibrionales bacterium]
MSYASFGPYGPQFEEFAGIVRQVTESAYAPGNLRRDVRSAFHPSGFWADRLMTLSQAFGGVRVEEFPAFWAAFAQVFRPALQDGRTLFGDMSGVLARAKVNQARATAQAATRHLRLQLQGICYGPYTERQLMFLKENHKRIVELGSGTGYLLSVLRARGIDAIGIEPGAYRATSLLDGSLPQIDNAYDWSKALHEEGALLRGSTELLPEHAAGRSLLLSWPEPGSLWPVEAIRIYREHGGKRLLLKLGGYVGLHFSPDPGYRPPVHPGANIRAFFEELAKFWSQSERSPDWEPELLENNLWSFEVRTAPRIFTWETDEGALSIPMTPEELRAERRRDRKKLLKRRKK